MDQDQRRKTILAGVGAGAAMLLLLFLVVQSIRASVGGSAASSRTRTLVCADTGKVFEEFSIGKDASFPIENPKTGKKSLWIAEACYWTRDGGAKLTPTWVLLNANKGIKDPTLCPDCGRVVVGHNPMPPQELLAKAAGK
jgi:hypothetical protein